MKNRILSKKFFYLDHSKLKIYKVDVYEGDSLTIPPGGGMQLKVMKFLLLLQKHTLEVILNI